MEKTLDYFMSIDYPINLSRLSEEDGGGWLAEHSDLKGCIADGETEVEAIENLKEAKELWILTALKRKITIPVPNNEINNYSGKLTFRMPKTLHMKLTSEAKLEGISLNQYILYLLTNNSSIKTFTHELSKLIEEKSQPLNINFSYHDKKTTEIDPGRFPTFQHRWPDFPKRDLEFDMGVFKK